MSPIQIGVAAASVLVAWLLVGLVRRYAVRHGVLDQPNARSSHSVPTPRGGGIGVVAAALLALAILAPREWWNWKFALGLFAVIPSALAGWIDDRRSLPPMPRLLAHCGSGILLLPIALSIPHASVATPFIAVLCVGAAVIAATVINFLDGLDGLIGLQAVVFGAHIALVAVPAGPAAVVGVALAGGAAGFLVWNWHPAKIFLGDVGSNALAILSLFAALLVLAEGRVGILAVFLPLFPLFLDALLTLLLRAANREPLAQAHRKHLYQRLANERWGHARVAMLYGAQAVLGSAVALLAKDSIRHVAFSLYILSMIALWAALHQRLRQSATV